MTIKDLLIQLRTHARQPILIRLPDGSPIAPHYHITEVAHVLKRFIDCGGTRRVQETCLLQTWVHDDLDHRLLAGKLADIFERAGDVLPHHDLEVEVEHELDAVSQFTLESASEDDGRLVLQLGEKHTDCLARGICLPNTCAPAPAVEIKGLPEFKPFPASAGACKPGSGCC